MQCGLIQQVDQRQGSTTAVPDHAIGGSRPLILANSIVALGLVVLFLDIAVAQDRMPSIPGKEMTDAQKKAAEELVAGPRAAVEGPFIPLLRSPELMNRLQKTGEYLRYQNALGQKLTEFVILLTAREWTQQFEFGVHAPLAVKAGVKPEIVKAIAEGRRPTGMTADEEVAYDLCTELRQNHSVSDITYAQAVSKFGEKGVVDMAALVGYYTTISMIMNVARTPAGKGNGPSLAPFPH